jgi:diaminopimelate decarboxylase
MNNYDWYYHCISASRADADHETKYKIAGPLCDGGDVYFDIKGTNKLPEHRLLPENVEAGEILAMLNCGAYSLAQMFPYNGRPLPAAVLIKENGEVELIRKRDSYELLIESDVW